MKLTRLLDEYIAEGCTARFTALLDDYGAWSSWTGSPGYRTGTRRPGPRFIDDDSALIIDRIMSEVKRVNKKVYLILTMYYAKKLSPECIAVIMRDGRPPRRKRQPRPRTGAYAANPIEGTALTSLELGPADIEIIVRNYTAIIYNRLLELRRGYKGA